MKSILIPMKILHLQKKMKNKKSPNGLIDIKKHLLFELVEFDIS